MNEKKLLTKEELKILKKLNTPIRIQDFLNTLPFNHEKKGETYMSPRRVLREQTAHCLEGALLAGLALLVNKKEAYLLDLKAPNDIDHVVCLYKINGFWGAISKTNHYCLRFRDPVYKTVRELALSYFHEYFLNKNGKKTLKSFSKPLNLETLKINWITSEKNLFELPDILDALPHYNIIPKKNSNYIRPADSIESRAGEIVDSEK